MEAYENGGHAYHATMPTDGLKNFRDVMKETQGLGFEAMKEAQIDLGNKIRAILEEHGYKSVAADGYKSPGVIVSYTNDPAIKSGQILPKPECKLLAVCHLSVENRGLLHISNRSLWLDKLTNIQRTVETFSSTLSTVQE